MLEAVLLPSSAMRVRVPEVAGGDSALVIGAGVIACSSCRRRGILGAYFFVRMSMLHYELARSKWVQNAVIESAWGFSVSR